jgi:superfamily II DNA or RNA helicase
VKVLVEGHHLRFTEISPVEHDWAKQLLSWESHDGRVTSVLWEEDGAPCTYANLLPVMLERAAGVADIEVSGLPERPEPPEFKVDPDCLVGRTLYPHQLLGVKKGVRGFRGILSLATAAGKTSILLALYKTLKPKQCFLIVPTMYLAEMIYEEALVRGLTPDQVGVLHGERKELRPFVIAVSDSLHSSMRKGDRFGKALAGSDLMLADEGHHLQSDTWREIWWASPALHKIAVTATPFTNREGDVLATRQDAMVTAAAGPVLYEVSNEYLISKGIVAQTYCVYLTTPGRKPFFPISPTKLHTQQISDNEWRNKKIVEMTRQARSFGFPVLILVSRTQHARTLMGMLRDEKVICKFQGGKSLQFDEHTGAIEEVGVTLSGPGSWVDQYESGAWDIIIGTPNLDEGVDLPDLGFTVFGGGGKSLRLQVQRRGRGSRRKKNGLNRAFMVDFTDRTHVWLFSHSRKRRAIFESSGTIVMEDQRRFWRLVSEVADSKEEK